MGRLDGDREPELGGGRLHLFDRRERIEGAGHAGDPGLLRRHCREEILSPIRVIAAGGGPDPDESLVDDPLGERGVLGQEPVPGVDGVRRWTPWRPG